MSKISKTVNPIHFEDFSGRQFERLVFAYLVRTEKWKNIEWYGEAGSDGGRDIWGVQQEDSSLNESHTCIQCANWKRMALSKAEQDIEKILKGERGLPDKIILFAGGSVSSNLRVRIRRFAESRGINDCQIVSGSEFEELLRAKSESLLKRFVAGVEFPDLPERIMDLALEQNPIDDMEILAHFAEALDRPAFTTPLHLENNLPDFEKALQDTIEVLNTGVHRLRDGTIIKRISSRHDIKDAKTKSVLAEITRKIQDIRSRFHTLIDLGEIKTCSSFKTSRCFCASDTASFELNRLRQDILASFKSIYPEFDVSLN